MSTDPLPYPTGTLRLQPDAVTDDTGRPYEVCDRCRTWVPAEVFTAHIQTHKEDCP